MSLLTGCGQPRARARRSRPAQAAARRALCALRRLAFFSFFVFPPPPLLLIRSPCPSTHTHIYNPPLARPSFFPLSTGPWALLSPLSAPPPSPAPSQSVLRRTVTYAAASVLFYMQQPLPFSPPPFSTPHPARAHAHARHHTWAPFHLHHLPAVCILSFSYPPSPLAHPATTNRARAETPPEMMRPIADLCPPPPPPPTTPQTKAPPSHDVRGVLCGMNPMCTFSPLSLLQRRRLVGKGAADDDPCGPHPSVSYIRYLLRQSLSLSLRCAAALSHII